jgi:hypothetical protein
MGEFLIEDWAISQGLHHEPGRNNLGHDCVINGLRMEVKLASLDARRVLQFNRIDSLRGADAAALVWMKPDDAGVWIVREDDVWSLTIKERAGRKLVVSSAPRWQWLWDIDSSPSGASKRLRAIAAGAA